LRALLLSAALALASGAFPGQEPAPKQVEPVAPPRAPIAGMTGFRSKSRVVIAAEPEQVLRLETFYVFPERVRWSLLPEGAAATERRLYFRFGASYWTIAPGEADSRPLGAPAVVVSSLQRTEIHMELRRAAMLWPDGLAWEGEGLVRRAHSHVGEHSVSASQPQPLVLVAQLDDAGRPKEIRVQCALQGPGTMDASIALVDITWNQQGERWWPHTFTLLGCGENEWHETVESIETAVNAVDPFFVPPDRRGATGAAPSAAPVLVRLPAVTHRRLPLPAGTAWGEALERAARLASEEEVRLEPLGGELQNGFVLELDDAGMPTAVVLRLARLPDPLPGGWESLEAREAATSRRPGIGPVSPAAIRQLRELLPSGAAADPPYARIVIGEDGAGTCQVVLPFQRPS